MQHVEKPFLGETTLIFVKIHYRFATNIIKKNEREEKNLEKNLSYAKVKISYLDFVSFPRYVAIFEFPSFK